MAGPAARAAPAPAAVVGLGCRSDPRRAVLRALFEICQVRPGEARRFRETGGRRIEHARDVRTIEDHSAYFWPLDRLGELSFLLDGGRRPPLPQAAPPAPARCAPAPARARRPGAPGALPTPAAPPHAIP